MKSLFTFMCLTFFIFLKLSAHTFYIDPLNGDINNDGSENAPWNTLEDVIAQHKIESYHYLPLPYTVDSKLEIFNLDAPIQAGDTLILLTGLHGDIFLRGYYNTKKISILAKEGHQPVFKTLRMTSCVNWVIDGITIDPELYNEYPKNRLVFIESHGWHGPTKHILLSNCLIQSTSKPWTKAGDWLKKASDGIYVIADSLEFRNNILRNVKHGINLKGNYLKAIHNKVINFSGDGARILGSNNLFEGNLIKNCYDVDENHDDGIQSYTTGSITVDNNIVRNNIILNYEDPNQPLLGPLQGLGFFDGPYRNWIVENNLIIVDHWHGITFLGGYDCLIRNNTVLDPTPDVKPGPTWIMIADDKDGTPSSGCMVQNNVANKFIVDGVMDHNQVFLNTTDYQNNFVDYQMSDFHLLKSSLLIDKGDSLSASAYDIEGNTRTEGTAPDIGAYEYINPVSTDNLEQESVFLYPNPASDRLFIIGNIKGYQLTVFDVHGKQKMQFVLDGVSNTLFLNRIPNGIYFLQFYNPLDGDIFVRKLVKL